MSEVPRYTSAGIGMARWYFRAGGALLAAAGIAVWFSTGSENALPAGLLVILGLAGFAFSFARLGDEVAHAARKHVEIADGD